MAITSAIVIVTAFYVVYIVCTAYLACLLSVMLAYSRYTQSAPHDYPVIHA